MSIRRKYFKIKKSLSFSLDGKETSLLIPYSEGQREYERILSAFDILIDPSIESLRLQLAFDNLIGVAIQNSFDYGIILFKEYKFIHTILLKRKNEIIIEEYLHWEGASNTTKILINEHLVNQVLVSDFKLLNFYNQVDEENIEASSDFILIKAQENEFSNPAPEYSFAAVKGIDGKQNLRNLINTLNQNTLVEVCDGLKGALLKFSWVDYITMNITCYHTLERYWYDADMTIKFSDIIFDIFDLLIATLPSGLAINKFRKNSLLSLCAPQNHKTSRSTYCDAFC